MNPIKSALAANAPNAGAPRIAIDFKQATELLAMFGDEVGEVTLSTGDGHSGKGLYAWYSELPEEGAEYLGVTDDEAAPAQQAGAPLLQEVAAWLHAAYDRPPQSPETAAMLARVDAACVGAPLPLAPSDALRDVLAEREKQRTNYGDPHDDEHGHRILSEEASGYLLSGQAPMRSSWCYNSKVRDRDPRRVQLVKGVALGLAAIECLDRGPRYLATPPQVTLPASEAEMRAILQELHDKFNTRVYGTGSYIKRDMRDRIAAVLATQAPSAAKERP